MHSETLLVGNLILGGIYMLRVNKVSKRYGNRIILDEITFTMGNHDRIALIGPNGTGKTTLLRIIAGLETPDSGTITSDSTTAIRYLPQHLTDFDTISLLEFLKPTELTSAEKQLRYIESMMENTVGNVGNEGLSKLLAEYGEAQEDFERLGGYEFQSKVDETLAGLNLHVSVTTRLSELSGGQKAKLALARTLLSNPSILLLDEPTNHLDLEAMIWLEDFINDFTGSVLVISHDRQFLNKTVNMILELDEIKHTITEYPGDYSNYYEKKAAEVERQYERFEDYQTTIKKIKKSIQRQKQWSQKGQGGPRKTDNEKLDRGQSKDRGANKSGSGAKAMEKKLERLEAVEKPWEGMTILTDFVPRERSGNMVVDVANAVKEYNRISILDHINLEVNYGDRVALVGPNGSGKSTLIKTIIGSIALDEGTIRIGSGVNIGYFSQEQEVLDFDSTVLKDFQKASGLAVAESRQFLSKALFRGEDVFKKIDSLSPGERSRLILARIMVKQPNFLVLDEPTNHLDLPSINRVEETIAAFPGTILVVSHDRLLLERVGINRIIMMTNGKIQQLHRGFAAYEEYLKQRE